VMGAIILAMALGAFWLSGLAEKWAPYDKKNADPSPRCTRSRDEGSCSDGIPATPRA
jgi:hypothetical protein